MDNYPEVASVEAKLRALDAADARCATETAPHTLVPYDRVRVVNVDP